MGQTGVEPENQRCIDSCRRQQPQPLGERRDEAGRLRGAQKLLRVRIEGDGHRARARLLRLFGNRRKNLAMAEVHAVENTDRRHRGTKAVGNFRN